MHGTDHSKQRTKSHPAAYIHTYIHTPCRTQVLYLRGCDEDGTTANEQWSIVGDTFLVGARHPSNTRAHAH